MDGRGWIWLYNQMEEARVPEPAEQPLQGKHAAEARLLACPLCKLTLQRPTTLACGHTFCHQCLIAAISRKLSENREERALATIPLCPRCLCIIWRPLASLKENVVLAGLVGRFGGRAERRAEAEVRTSQDDLQFHILIDLASHNNTLLPHCYSQVVFATAFIDEILEQQAQSNLVVLRWPNAPPNTAIAGRLFRPETYHYNMDASRFETVYKAIFEGRYFVRVTDWQQLDLKVSAGRYSDSSLATSPLALCQVEELKASNPLALVQFSPFFEVYDKLNNPVYLRQISQMVDEKLLHDRSEPEKLIYCAMRLLRLSEKEVAELAQLMDDQQRWERMEDFLVKNSAKPAVEVIKIDIPGNYPHALMIALLILMIVFHYMAK